jgi:hypothetical protein
MLLQQSAIEPYTGILLLGSKYPTTWSRKEETQQLKSSTNIEQDSKSCLPTDLSSHDQ